MKRAVITGTTGLLGANLAEHLLNENFHVVGCRRQSSKIDHLAHLNIEWRDAPLESLKALKETFEGADVVFHCAAAVDIVKARTKTLVEVNLHGTERVLKACESVKVPRLIHTSTVAAVGVGDGHPSTETQPYNFEKFGLADGYSTTKRDAERAALRFTKEHDLNVVVVNPGYMFGAYDIRPSSGALIRDLILGRVPGITAGRNNFADVCDVARGMRLAFEKGKRAERYILAGHNLSYEEIIHTIAKIANIKAPTWKIPRALASAMGKVYDLKEKLRGRSDILNSNTMTWAYEKNFVFSSEKAIKELGYRISPLEDCIERCIDWFRTMDMI